MRLRRRLSSLLLADDIGEKCVGWLLLLLLLLFLAVMSEAENELRS